MYGCIFRSAEQLYGSQFLTLNMHLHLHLPECFQDYGPCYSFWLFSFERYNGILGRYHTNHRSIEIQLMQKFMENMHMKSLVNDIETIPSESESCLMACQDRTQVLLQTIPCFVKACHHLKLAHYYRVLILMLFQHQILLIIFRLSYYHFSLCTNSIWRILSTPYYFIQDISSRYLPQLCRKYRCAVWISERLNCSKFSSKNFICVQAYWPERNGKITTDCKTLWTENQSTFLVREFASVGCLRKLLWLKSSGLRNIKRRKV